jgi:hypothetical protein
MAAISYQGYRQPGTAFSPFRPFGEVRVEVASHRYHQVVRGTLRILLYAIQHFKMLEKAHKYTTV